MHDALQALLEALFRVLFTYDCLDEEKVPRRGPAVIAANHPSYLDPVLLSLQLDRPIRFMAWDAIFRVPLLGSLLRVFGAFPVDVRRGSGGSGYDTARQLLEDGELVGIFPEGRRSRTGWMEPELRAGAARLALETGAPLVPATIRGAFRAWPHFRLVPTLATIRVRYHDPIDPAPYRELPADQAVPALLAELRRRVERTLMPGVKADARIDALWRGPAPWPRLFEAGPALGLALVVFWKTRSFAAVWPCYAYIGYLLADLLVLPQSRLAKWIRNASGAVFTLVYGGWALPRLGMPAVAGGRALVAVMGGLGFAYLYERGRVATAFVEGVVLTAVLELLALRLVPTPLGPQLALPLFAAAFAWEERTVFWRYAAPLALAYALAVPFRLGGRWELLPHGFLALLAMLLLRVLAGVGSRSAERGEPEAESSSTLGLGR